jgi:hypothetical protein
MKLPTMKEKWRTTLLYVFGPGPRDNSGYLRARWLFLRALGLIFFSAFYSFLFQVDGLIGPHGILPATEFLKHVAEMLGGATRFWYVPSLFWLGSGTAALKAACWIGLAASVLLILNIWPRGSVAICTLLYLSFISTLEVFSSYQSDGMLLEAGLLSFFFAPEGWRPELGEADPPSRMSRFLLLFLCFRIYFESGLAKMMSGDPHWRHFTAMDDYYQNGPLPTWIGWYAQQFMPHGWHAFCTAWTLAAELILVWLFFVPNRRARIITFWVLLPFQTAIILTANYAFINHITLALAVLLLDDRHLERLRRFLKVGEPLEHPPRHRHPVWLWTSIVCLAWVFYANTALLVRMLGVRLPMAPVMALEPFRFANRFGLFAVMTPARYEIEFQGSPDGKTWTPYPFKYKPQDLKEAPRIYAPYQPRFDWNLWFASLAPWRENLWVVRVQELLLQNNSSVLSLFRSNPFKDTPPTQVRSVLYQYWFTEPATLRREGVWWRRQDVGLFGPTLAKLQGDRIGVVAMPPEH